jgi:hypothetical protein
VKTTVEIPDPLFREAKAFAARNGIPMREIFERGLETVLRGAKPAARRFRLKTVTTKGQGLVCEDDWGAIRSLIYEGHGG